MLVGTIGGIGLAGCDKKSIDIVPVVFTEAEKRAIFKHSPLPPPPPNPTNRWADDPEVARLGARLFFDSRLSMNGQISCASCHDPERGFSDEKVRSEGLATTDRHSPALWNVAYQRWFFWDGRSDSLWSQSIQPLLSAREMGANYEHIFKVVSSDPILPGGYESAFGAAEGHSPGRFLSNLGKALEAYQRTVISRDSPFDGFVAALKSGQPNSDEISESAKRGLRIFINKQCSLCHSGPNFSDGEFHNLGLPHVANLKRDAGRYEGISKLLADEFNGMGEFSDDRSEKTNIKLRYLSPKLNNYSEFKTPTLRNVATSAPYMHNGSMADLQEILDFYNKLPSEAVLGHREETLVPLNLSSSERVNLEAFLRALTGSESFN